MFELWGVGLEAGGHPHVVDAEEATSSKGYIDFVPHDGDDHWWW